MIVVTGGAGFIGSNLVKALNRRGLNEILVVDDFAGGDAKTEIETETKTKTKNETRDRNLTGLSISDYMDKHDFLKAVRRDRWPGRTPVSVVFHQGACTDTLSTDEAYLRENNYDYSEALYHFCEKHRAQYIYASSASVYGAGDVFVEAPQNESALNLYARSKLRFDEFVRAHPPEQFQCVGLRYFNVYGPREQHKARMASVPWHFFHQYGRDGRVRLFEGSGGYPDGEQRRDFISVEDVVAVNLFFMDHPSVNGIYNVGTGRSRSFNEVAVAVLNACRRHRGEAQITLARALEAGEIAYIPMPEALRGKYQSYTQANLEQLRGAGYAEAFLDIEQGVGNYVDELLGGERR